MKRKASLPKPYKYKLPPNPAKQPVDRLRDVKEKDELTGFVRGQVASDNEERFARSLSQRRYDYDFQRWISTPFQIPGQDYEIDFVVYEMGIHPIEIDGSWVHKSAEAQEQDKVRDALLDDLLSKAGWQPIRRIKVDESWEQEDFDEVVEEIFG